MSRVQMILPESNLESLEKNSIIKDATHNSILAYYITSDNNEIIPVPYAVPYDIPVENNFCKYIKLLASNSDSTAIDISPTTNTQVFNETA